MPIKFISRAAALGMCVVLTSCYWENEETLYGSTEATCDVTAVTLSGSVNPILDYNCNGCHDSSSASALGGNIVLDQYNLLKKYADNGSLLGSIKHQSGYEAMPKSAAKLTACDILTIQTWIANGAQND